MYRGTYIPLGRDGLWEAQEWFGFTLPDRRALLRGSEAWGAGVCKNEAAGDAVAAEAPWKVAPGAPGAAVSAKAPVCLGTVVHMGMLAEANGNVSGCCVRVCELCP